MPMKHISYLFLNFFTNCPCLLANRTAAFNAYLLVPANKNNTILINLYQFILIDFPWGAWKI